MIAIGAVQHTPNILGAAVLEEALLSVPVILLTIPFPLSSENATDSPLLKDVQ